MQDPVLFVRYTEMHGQQNIKKNKIFTFYIYTKLFNKDDSSAYSSAVSWSHNPLLCATDVLLFPAMNW
jgi:hypothetical protein